MQMRRTYHFGDTFGGLPKIDLPASAAKHRPHFRELSHWYLDEHQDKLRSINGRLPKKANIEDWFALEEVVEAYWQDHGNLRRGILPPDPDYTGDAHLSLEDGTASLLTVPTPPKGRKPKQSPRMDSPRASDSGNVSPRAREAAASSPELDEESEMDEEEIAAQMPKDHAPPFPTLGYWLPPLSRPLTSITQQHRVSHHVIAAHTHERKDPQLPATWSLSPTPLSKARLQRYTTHPKADPVSDYMDVSTQAPPHHSLISRGILRSCT